MEVYNYTTHRKVKMNKSFKEWREAEKRTETLDEAVLAVAMKALKKLIGKVTKSADKMALNRIHTAEAEIGLIKNKDKMILMKALDVYDIADDELKALKKIYLKEGFIMSEEKTKGKFGYEIYHDSYTAALAEMRRVVALKKLEMDEDDYWMKIASGRPKPTKGQTRSEQLQLLKNGKESRRMVHVQIYNRGSRRNPYELNMYFS